MRGQANMSPFYIFLAVIGDLTTFGIFGLIFGPLIIAIAIVVVDIYRNEHTTPDRSTKTKRPVLTHGPKGYGARGKSGAR